MGERTNPISGTVGDDRCARLRLLQAAVQSQKTFPMPICSDLEGALIECTAGVAIAG